LDLFTRLNLGGVFFVIVDLLLKLKK